MHFAESSQTIRYYHQHFLIHPIPKLKYSLNYQGDSKNANKTPGLMYTSYS